MHTRASSVRSTYGQTQMRLRGNTFNGSIHNHNRTSLKSIAVVTANKTDNSILNHTTDGTTTILLNNFGHTNNEHHHDNGTNHKMSWQRNNFRPLHPELIEFEGDEDQHLIEEKGYNTTNAVTEFKNGQQIKDTSFNCRMATTNGTKS